MKSVTRVKPIARALGYVRAARFMVQLPKKSRELPPASYEKSRSRFDAEVAFIELWKMLARPKKVDLNTFLASDSFSTHIRRIDDLLDKPRAPSPTDERVYYQRDPFARKTISAFVSYVRTTELTPGQKKKILRLTAQFRRQSWHLFREMESKKPLTMREVYRHKLNTTGRFIKVFVQILNEGHNVPTEKRTKITRAMVYGLLATQIIDDIFDYKEDAAANTVNFCEAVLRKYPDEKRKTESVSALRLPWFRRNCPQTYADLMRLFNSLVSRVPKEGREYETLEAFVRMNRLLFHLSKKKPRQ